MCARVCVFSEFYCGQLEKRNEKAKSVNTVDTVRKTEL